MVESARYKDWINMAKKDLNGAKILYEHGGDNYLICFHCQQAIEKYLKGYLIRRTSQLIEGHSLIKLCKLSQKYNTGFRNFLKDVALVNDYYMETRYPADQPLTVNDEDTQECLDIVQNIMNFIDNII